MALKLNIPETPIGLALEEGYCRVAGITIATVEGRVQVQVQAFLNEKAAREGKQPVVTSVFEARSAEVPQLQDKPWRVACYLWLKTLPAFAGAKDV